MQPTQQFYFYIVVFPLFHPNVLISSKIFKNYCETAKYMAFSQKSSWLESWEPYVSAKCELAMFNFGPNVYAWT
jgi:hypothetical protein